MEWAFVPYDQFYSVAVSPSPGRYNRTPRQRYEGHAEPSNAFHRDWSDAIARWTRKCSGDDGAEPANRVETQKSDPAHVKITAHKQIERKIGALDAASQAGNGVGNKRRCWQWCSLGKK